MKSISLISIALILNVNIYSQNVKRPPIWGIAKMTYLVSSDVLAQSYYGDFLGFDKAFTYPSPLGKITTYKVNDRQFLEFVEDKQAKEKDRLVSVTFETEDVEKMRQYLSSKGIKVPAEITVDGAGNLVFVVYDPVGVPIEFMEWGKKSLHAASKGKYLSERRISKRIHHVGLYTEILEDNPTFYTEILGCKLFLRFPEDVREKPGILYFQIPGTTEFIEHYPTDTRDFSHPCFLATDMQEVLYTLKERRRNEKLANPIIGKGRRWLLNLSNADGTRIEFTEMFLAK
ncbi:MAG: VOC family protein [Bacteroidales bacterium]|jgi:catechol 2,3-dioxygenase-like lactoylglutathione lyase family enzyme|nr:VOC family protein [Bacteroidales bacterium]